MKKRFLTLMTMIAFTGMAIAQSNPCYGPNTATNGDMQTYTAPPAAGNAWINSYLTNWHVSHGTPSLGGTVSIWLWSYNGSGEGVYMDHNFVAGQEYRVTYDVYKSTDANPASEFFVRLSNNLTPSTGSTAMPSTAGTQVVSNLNWTNTGTWLTITETFIAGSNYSQLWLYPLLTGSPNPNQAAATIDNIVIEEVIECPCEVNSAFEYQQGAGCTFEFFDASSTGANPANQILGYSWDFGDGGRSTEQEPMHNYTSAGTYDVCLTVWGASGMDCCSDTYCQTVVVTDACNPCDFIMNVVPEVNCTAGTSECEFTATNIANDFPGAMGYHWDFGDGTYGTGAQVTHEYTTQGPFIACLTVYYQDPATGECCSYQACIDVAGAWKVNEINMDSGALELFPNPASESTKLKIQNDQIKSIEIYSLNGQLVQFPVTFSKGNKQAEINTSAIAGGIYMVLIQGDSGMIYSKKLIVE